jgi:hypothetical protein
MSNGTNYFTISILLLRISHFPRRAAQIKMKALIIFTESNLGLSPERLCMAGLQKVVYMF